MARHSPGPWSVDKTYQILDKNLDVIGVLRPTKPGNYKDKELIAIAPDLLIILKLAIESWELGLSTDEDLIVYRAAKEIIKEYENDNRTKIC